MKRLVLAGSRSRSVPRPKDSIRSIQTACLKLPSGVTTIFDPDEIRRVVRLQQKSYELLKWTGEALGRGIIDFNTAHENMSAIDAAAAWIGKFIANFPPRARPDSSDHLDTFAMIFTSYLQASFDLTESPGSRIISGCGCFCPFCCYLAPGSHIKPKKTERRDKAKADKWMSEMIERLGRAEGLDLEVEPVTRLVETQREKVGLVTYGWRLKERIRTGLGRPADLVLWRTFAWTDSRPKKKFKLKADDILNAERSLIEELRTITA